MSIIEHPDMPKSILGIQGLNLWNILLAMILLAWLVNGRSKEGLVWDMPRHITILLFLYLTIILLSFARMIGDQEALIQFAYRSATEAPTTAGLFSEHIINSVKWIIPGLLLFDGCRSRSRFLLALVSILTVYLLLGVQVIKWMPMSSAISGAQLTERSLKILSKEVGYHRVNLSMMLAGASWAVYATRPMIRNKGLTYFIVAVSIVIFYAQALTGGRTGYVTWGVVGLILCTVRWKKYLLFAPILVIAIIALLPSTLERMTQGFSEESIDYNSRVDDAQKIEVEGVDMYTVTAGRNVAWPYVLDKIHEAPLFGYGREAMKRSGITTYLWEELGESFPHPHNAYLEWTLDNGLMGLLPVMLLYLILIKYSFMLFRDSISPTCNTIGGVSLALILALLIASMGSQTFYPREGSVGMWCAIGLLLRVYVERSRLLQTREPSSHALTQHWIIAE